MYEVELIFRGKTDVWMTADVVSAILEHDNVDEGLEIENASGAMLKKIEYWSQAGFLQHEGKTGTGKPIKHEDRGIYRLGLHGDLFRVYGFYEDDSLARRTFIAIAAHADKKGKKNTRRERQIIKHVEEVKINGDWRKKPDAPAKSPSGS